MDPQNFQNVKEHWHLYDTVLVSPFVDSLPSPVPGWFNSFAALGQADNLTFFNTRNKSIGLAYCNQESRDQLAYAMEIDSISVRFFAPSAAGQISNLPDEDIRYPVRIDMFSPFWECDLPTHVSCIFRVNQDDILKTACPILPGGYGPSGFSFGQGDMSANGGISGSASMSGMGPADIKYRWEFPNPIQVPRRASMSVRLDIAEWARVMLQSMWGPPQLHFNTYDGTDGQAVPTELTPILKPAVYGIQVLVAGARMVQQRGEHHV